jgi:hypothetical protein
MWAERASAEVRDGLGTLDARYFGRAALWAVASLVAFGVVAAIIPNPVFGRSVPPTASSILIWIASAPLMGLVAATYGGPAVPATGGPVPLAELGPVHEGTTLGSIAGFGAFLAIGCPVCNKIALVLLGTSGAMSVYAPIQPYIGVVSLTLLVVTFAWRLRLRARGGACPA